MNSAEATVIVGGVSEPGKMPGIGWGISALRCKTGSKLRNVPGSSCANCYAMKGRYPMPNVQRAHERRLGAYELAVAEGAIEMWIEAMAHLARSKRGKGYFRWFDSGDLQSLDMLKHIFEVARRAPEVKFWVPTKEKEILAELFRDWTIRIPPNVALRYSLPMINSAAGGQVACAIGRNHPDINRFAASVVYSGERPWQMGVFYCEAYKTTPASCGDCRACWDTDNHKVIGYKEH